MFRLVLSLHSGRSVLLNQIKSCQINASNGGVSWYEKSAALKA